MPIIRSALTEYAETMANSMSEDEIDRMALETLNELSNTARDLFVEYKLRQYL